MKTWQLAVLVGAITAAGVTGAALALDDRGQADGRDGGPTAMIARTDDSEGRASADPRSAMHELLQDPEFRDELWKLRDEQQTAMRAWWDAYGDDPTSDEAQDALDALRDAHHEAMDALLEKYGVEAGTGPDSDVQELMSNEDFRNELWKLQDEAEAAVQSWWDEYGDDPESAEAREALRTLREEQRAGLEALYEKYGVELDGRDGFGRGPVMGGGLFGDGLLPDGHVGRGGAGGHGEGFPSNGAGSSTGNSSVTL